MNKKRSITIRFEDEFVNYTFNTRKEAIKFSKLINYIEKNYPNIAISHAIPSLISKH